MQAAGGVGGVLASSQLATLGFQHSDGDGSMTTWKMSSRKLTVAEASGGGFLQTDIKSLHQAGEAQLTEGGLELCHGFGFCGGSMR